ncbi:hypothetical protein VIGAN_03163000 [Vigna angularis var. angularis]|uniref:Uncharacterized protein n=1 Tax=Vigna angularis var. angularis TaxID=157739 RepID=A0A0S3RME9_PHAAN|nr:hypothetical protein VIGAN_03163000 [Vigna angularis var. angularis]
MVDNDVPWKEILQHIAVYTKPEEEVSTKKRRRDDNAKKYKAVKKLTAFPISRPAAREEAFRHLEEAAGPAKEMQQPVQPSPSPAAPPFFSHTVAWTWRCTHRREDNQASKVGQQLTSKELEWCHGPGRR